VFRLSPPPFSYPRKFRHESTPVHRGSKLFFFFFFFSPPPAGHQAPAGFGCAAGVPPPPFPPLPFPPFLGGATLTTRSGVVMAEVGPCFFFPPFFLFFFGIDCLSESAAFSSLFSGGLRTLFELRRKWLMARSLLFPLPCGGGAGACITRVLCLAELFFFPFFTEVYRSGMPFTPFFLFLLSSFGRGRRILARQRFFFFPFFLLVRRRFRSRVRASGNLLFFFFFLFSLSADHPQGPITSTRPSQPFFFSFLFFHLSYSSIPEPAEIVTSVSTFPSLSYHRTDRCSRQGRPTGFGEPVSIYFNNNKLLGPSSPCLTET